MLGECIGLAYHPSDGMCRVFQSLDTTKLVVLVSKAGNHRFMRRELVQWRTPSKSSTQVAGRTTPARAERAGERNVVRDMALFELE